MAGPSCSSPFDPLFDPENRRKVIEKNREVVEDVYSQETVGKKLYDLITASG